MVKKVSNNVQDCGDFPTGITNKPGHCDHLHTQPYLDHCEMYGSNIEGQARLLDFFEDSTIVIMRDLSVSLSTQDSHTK